MGALLELQDVWREFNAGEETVAALRGVSLRIEAGEMLAIVGASGSGKSTLMNVLGCLDRPSRGSYCVDGRDTRQMDADELAALRRERFGFIFQRYHLLPALDALANVEIPAVYAGAGGAQRSARAAALLQRLGMGDRLSHRPAQLSGGQQQRVSIARALMNGGEVILADEPTGALDTHSGREVMDILKALNAAGHTVIIVTHDMGVAAHARRIIEISDGAIVVDRKTEAVQDAEAVPQVVAVAAPQGQDVLLPAQAPRRQGAGWLTRFAEALRMALVSLNAHRLRAALTMLGIVIGIAAVVSVVALGQGTRDKVLSDINAMGTDTIQIFPGQGFGDERAGEIRTLVGADAEALAGQLYADSVTPDVSQTVGLRYGNVARLGVAAGVGDQYFRVNGLALQAGRIFDGESIRTMAQEAVIDANTRRELFGDEDPLGKTLFLGQLPVRVIGVVAEGDSVFNGMGGENLRVWIPYTAAMARLTGSQSLRSITVRVDDAFAVEDAERQIVAFLEQRHGVRDFFTFNMDSIRQTVERTTRALTLLISTIALISLVVGGIGVMNIMLVSVTERTREIGVRMAVGARRADIMRQFLIEAVLVCLLGGLAGILLSLGLGELVRRAGIGLEMIYSVPAMLTAFASATAIGVVFGFLPARNASRLDPVEALARD
ncbi:macrolide transport system ATP-binding/permease protein [Kerstersia gyiorum]|uniref:Pyoverdine export ATP-binding/permease protein PvdT n=1 Tax=Kerstersia gyiorum TaxID=206506 RepID=A0A4Q7MG04_9BURK|nr:MacB family efflux pump subunit [Kerstersia gyiorum]KAB0542280.1 MacB family efflux pump subunit [Kerstersia gyiorum]RZS65329.1 macrolide transport system ATP-binding/permease protein [Kerstersia gyiorum]